MGESHIVISEGTEEATGALDGIIPLAESSQLCLSAA